MATSVSLFNLDCAEEPYLFLGRRLHHLAELLFGLGKCTDHDVDNLLAKLVDLFHRLATFSVMSHEAHSVDY